MQCSAVADVVKSASQNGSSYKVRLLEAQNMSKCHGRSYAKSGDHSVSINIIIIQVGAYRYSCLINYNSLNWFCWLFIEIGR